MPLTDIAVRQARPKDKITPSPMVVDWACA